MSVKSVGTAAVLVVGIALSGFGLASAAPAPAPSASRDAIAPANSVNGTSVINGSLYCPDLGAGMCDWFTSGPFNNTVRTETVTDGTLLPQDFSQAAKDALKGATGNTGGQGPVGPEGPQGPKGDAATWSGKHWGSVLRNVIGSGSAELKATSTTAPTGDGALEIHTATAADKAAFGNEVDFAGDDVSAITALEMSVYTTGENSALAPNNMPSITFEIDPNLASSTRSYSSMVFAPNNSASNTWTKLDATDDALGKVWGLTGADMPCNINGARCTWSELQAALADGGDPAKVLTLQVTKGRDFAFHGAVDDLKYNANTFDFEPTGVK